MVMNVIGVSLKYAALAVKKKYFEIFMAKQIFWNKVKMYFEILWIIFMAKRLLSLL